MRARISLKLGAGTSSDHSTCRNAWLLARTVQLCIAAEFLLDFAASSVLQAASDAYTEGVRTRPAASQLPKLTIPNLHQTHPVMIGDDDARGRSGGGGYEGDAGPSMSSSSSSPKSLSTASGASSSSSPKSASTASD